MHTATAQFQARPHSHHHAHHHAGHHAGHHVHFQVCVVDGVFEEVAGDAAAVDADVQALPQQSELAFFLQPLHYDHIVILWNTHACDSDC